MSFINSDAAVPGLNRNQAYANKLLFPSGALIAQFDKVIKPCFEMKRVLGAQVNRLKATRDALLPRLISGKLSVDALNIRFPLGCWRRVST